MEDDVSGTQQLVSQAKKLETQWTYLGEQSYKGDAAGSRTEAGDREGRP